MKIYISIDYSLCDVTDIITRKRKFPLHFTEKKQELFMVLEKPIISNDFFSHLKLFYETKNIENYAEINFIFYEINKGDNNIDLFKYELHCLLECTFNKKEDFILWKLKND